VLCTAVIFLGIVVGLWLLLVLILVALGKRTSARELAMLVPNLAMLFKGLLTDPRVPRGSKVFLLLAVGWFASPIDLIPEFIPFLGPLDDAVVAALVLRRILKTAGENVVREHWRGDHATLDKILRLSGAKRAGGVE
jgi:uncharacterized membrane protein YkvA (DUF1232 family)